MDYLQELPHITQEEMLFGMRIVELITQELPPAPNETMQELVARIQKASQILKAKGILSMEYKSNGKMKFTVLDPEYFKITVH